MFHLRTLCFFFSYGDGHGMDIAKAIQGCDDQHSVVLLAHQPKAAKFALDSEHDIQLVLSGRYRFFHQLDKVCSDHTSLKVQGS